MAYTLTYNSSTAITTPAINSTKVVVYANVACYANINGTAVSTSAFPLILPNRKNDFNMQGLGNTLSLLPVGGGAAAITIQQVGNVFPSGTATGYASGNTTVSTGNAYTAG
jgi:hypothetical protein